MHRHCTVLGKESTVAWVGYSIFRDRHKEAVDMIPSLDCSAKQCTNGAWCPRRTADAEQRSKRPITY